MSRLDAVAAVGPIADCARTVGYVGRYSPTPRRNTALHNAQDIAELLVTHPRRPSFKHERSGGALDARHCSDDSLERFRLA
jgi:hypothetical protein